MATSDNNSIENIILVLSGKGGVGKSTVTTLLALQLSSEGYRVGVLDLDLCGPSLPKMMGLQGTEVLQDANGWRPVLTKSDPPILAMSIGFFLEKQDDPIIWRGPKKKSMITQLLREVSWSTLDYLFIDTPPGTSDEHISILEALADRNKSALIVSTPQIVALNDVRREITFCHKMSLPILGLIENMSGFVCPNCTECTNIFSSEGCKSLAGEMEVRFLGTLPISLPISWGEESGITLKSSEIRDNICEILKNIKLIIN
ncbi:hypothetical protein LOD99_5806 [Oopsacas minuta]|uniref:Cytosolic Fe-S cluster assembly factor NUBP2 homolog n=1 Tax=Oopsacas minuta TaxID=111878 RepID=A0AAV7JQ80_9METZ|nr:hypothetical protein LOD99_5806 [Oopsacas minuta]